MRAELIPAGQTEHSPSRGDAELLHVKVATASADLAARRYPDSPLAELRHLVRLEWDAMSEWFEEDEPIYTHPRDPHTRVGGHRPGGAHGPGVDLPHPLPESQKIADLACFYNEKVDVFLDGVRQDKPRSPFS